MLCCYVQVCPIWEYISFRHKRYIESCDTILVYARLTEKQFNKNTDEWKIMKNLTAANRAIPEVVLSGVRVEPYNDHSRVFSEGDFQRIFLEAADEAFALLGKKVEQSIYSQMEETFKIARKDIPVHIERFTRALEEIIGPGATLLEIEMMKRLHEKVGPGFKYHARNENLTFLEYLKAIRVFLSVCARPKSLPNEYYYYKFC